MPKRIVDLALVEHGNKILCADKFGDVFAIPLFPPTSDSEPTSKPSSGTPALDTGMAGLDTTEKVYESEEQKQRHIERQKANIAREQAAAERRKRLQVDYNIPFAHDFVLGHVSMLLSLLTITLPADHAQANGKEKTWILTSDRDEHIRITRFPQSFVIEGFCLGHTQFVKTMLAPSWDLTSLVSGGGDEYLLVWDWKERKIVQKVDLVVPVQAVLGPDAKIFVPKTGERGEAEASEEEGIYKFAVSGLWEVPSIHGILVGIERVPALFLFTFTQEGLKHTSTLSLPGNFLDAAVLPGNKVFASVDPADAGKPLLGAYTLTETGEWSETTLDGVARIVEQCVVEAVDLSEELVGAMAPHVLYPVGSLRKEYGIKDKEDKEC
jgi:tRNA (guanine-N(7)-)-methyltransferase subunit TRM82